MTVRRNEEAGFTIVELLVVLTILGAISATVTGIIISTMRVEQNQQQLQAVVDDGRLSVERIRQELRQVRRVYESSGPDRLHVWIDRDQDAQPSPEEELCYVVEDVPGSSGGQYQISRWSHAEVLGTESNNYNDGDCAPGALPSGQTRTVVARTLVDDEPFISYSPLPGDLLNPTREVDILLDLEVLGARGPESITVESSIRLRNVS